MKNKIAKPKILFFAPTPPPYAGPEISTQLLLDSDLKNQFDICHIRANFNLDNKSKGRLNPNNLSAAFRLFPKLVYHLNKIRPKILYTYLSQNRLGLLRDAVVVTLGRLFRAKIIMHLHGSNFANYYKYASYFERLLAHYVCKKVHTFIVLAALLKNQFKDLLPNGYRVKSIYNAVDAEKLLPNIESYKDLIYYRRKKGKPLKVLFIGHHSINKGYYDLLTAIPNVIESLSCVKFISAGQIKKKDSFKVYENKNLPADFKAKEKTLMKIRDKHTELKGFVWGKNKTSLFMDADIFVLPSYSEGMPIALLEAMAAGLPLVTTPVGAIPEFFKNGINGLIVRPGQAHEISDALLCLLKNPHLRERVGRANFDLARKSFHPTRLVQSMIRVFNEVLN